MSNKHKQQGKTEHKSFIKILKRKGKTCFNSLCEAKFIAEIQGKVGQKYQNKMKIGKKGLMEQMEEKYRTASVIKETFENA